MYFILGKLSLCLVFGIVQLLSQVLVEQLEPVELILSRELLSSVVQLDDKLEKVVEQVPIPLPLDDLVPGHSAASLS